MTKQKVLTVTILILVALTLIITVFVIKLSRPKKDEIALEPSSSPLSEEENNKISDENKLLTMSEKRARSIAKNSECVNDGALKDNAFYNENSKTWWIDLDIGKPGCNPACVVYEDETVEINWRCMGLIQ